tara:strand:+ start:332 stop:679 length:348 start_codon:yes stop_codon:yes gene_type:complete
MRVLFVAALSVALLSTPAAASMAAYCKQTRQFLAPVFRAAIYHRERKVLQFKREKGTDSCFFKYPYDEPRRDRCNSKVLSKYPELDPLPKSEDIDEEEANRFLLKMAPIYSAYCN